jgi:dCMP deaminase
MNYYDFLLFANSEAKLSKCLIAKVGCVIIDEDKDNIVSWGHNKLFKNKKACKGKCEKINNCIKIFHAEEIAIFNAIEHENSLKNTTMILTHSPCFYCAKLIILSGIKKIIYKNIYNDTRCNVLDLLNENGIILERIENENNLEV